MQHDRRYSYYGTVERIVDGDTVDLSIDLGLRIYVRERTRLAYVDAPEHRGPKASDEGKVAKQVLESLLPVGSDVKITTLKATDKKRGRYVSILHPIVDGEVSGTSVNEMLIKKGVVTQIDSGA